jgi:hypothetical protein
MVILIVSFLGIQENPGPKQSYLRRVRIRAHGANFYITGSARTATDFCLVRFEPYQYGLLIILASLDVVSHSRIV